jgi:tetratricopeptide (TPR) repeat protein
MKLKTYILLALGCLLLFAGCVAKRPSGSGPAEPKAVDPISLDAARAYDAGDLQKSLDLYSSLAAADPTNPVYLNNKGVLLLRGGKVKEALDAFESASLQAPTEADYLVNIGLAQVKLGENDDALEFFDRALRIDPRNSQAFYGKGLAYVALDESEIALGLFRQAVAADPTNADALFMQAYAAQLNGLWLDAVKGYTAYLGLGQDPVQKANAYSNRALCYFQTGSFANGMSDLDAAMKINDASPIYYYNRAQGYQMRQKYEQAVDDYTRAISRQSSFPEAYINRGELNYLLEKEEKGCSDLKRACDLGFCGPFEKYESAGKCTD